ncbi:MAG: CvpA family protein [Chloroflexi bacterium]|nr:CvpA family protein [Chloroflexota bacterium]
MNWLDIVIAIVLAAAAFYGLRSGLIKVTLSLAGIVVGVTLAGRYYAALAERLTFIPQDNIAKIVAFAIILVGVIVIAQLLSKLLKMATSIVPLSWVDHLGGAALGLVLGGFFCAALLTIWAKYLGIGNTIAESALARLLLERLPVLLALLPEEFDSVRSFFQ